MDCCQCEGIEGLFSTRLVASELSRYRRKGPDRATRRLVEALKSEGVLKAALLDIGGGFGAIQHELLEAGADHALSIEASSAYLKAAEEEADRRGLAGRIRHTHGDFVRLADDIPASDIVTLNRVICCYPDMPRLVGLSAARAKRLYGLVYPRDTWWVKLVLSAQNLLFRVRGNPFRTFVHPTRAVEALLSRQGLRRRFYHRTLFWQIAVFAH